MKITGLGFNDTAAYQCDRGYHLEGDETITCTGEWNNAIPKCIGMFPINFLFYLGSRNYTKEKYIAKTKSYNDSGNNLLKGLIT